MRHRRPSRRRLVPASVVAAVVAAAVVPVGPSLADPVCTDPASRELCGGRVFPEPSESATALTYAQTVAGLRALEAEFPDLVRVEVIGQSANGEDLVLVEATDEASTSVPYQDRKIVLVNQSIHGNEPGGREGGPRYLEDLLRGDDPDRAALLDRVRLVQTFVNPDGWVAGDPEPGALSGDGVGLWNRGNGSGPGAADVGGTDLNRQAPWRGLIPDGRDPVSQPESLAFAQLVQGWVADGQDIQVSTDIHGEVPDTAAEIMLSSGQFDLQGAFQQRMHGEAMAAAVEAALEGEPLLQPGGALFGVVPAKLVASSEFQGGGSGSGFQGDWVAQPEGGDSASTSTIELFSLDGLPVGGPGLNALTARREILQVYRDTVAAIMGAMLDQAVVDHVPAVTGTGRVAHVADQPLVQDPVRTDVQVSTATFFDELAPYMDAPLAALAPADVDAAGLADVDDLVVTTDGLADDADALAAVRAFAEAGGNVVLTDDALTLLPALVEGVAAEDVTVTTDGIGRTTFVDRAHPLAAGVREIAFMLTETATTGRIVTGSESNVPTWRVDRAAWEAAGGTTATTSGDQTSVGTIPTGDGSLHVVGVLLPEPQGDAAVEGVGRNLYGLNAHGVLDTGYHVLVNALGGTLTITQVPSVVPGEPGDELAVTVGADREVEERAATQLRAATTGGTSPVSVTWDVGDGSPPIAGATVTHAWEVPGTYTATATASDGDGNTASASVEVTVLDRARVQRRAGADRVATAVAVAAGGWPGGADQVVVARSDAFPDALAGSRLADAVGAPILLTPPDDLPDVVRDEVDRLDPARVVVLGGPGAVSEAVLDELDGEGREVVRIAGDDRFATAAAIASAVGPSDDETVVLALGQADDPARAWPDALSASSLAVAPDGLPILLTRGDEVPGATLDALARLDTRRVLVAGGTSAISTFVVNDLRREGYVVDRVAGDTRYGTSSALAEVALARWGDADVEVVFATGRAFPDGLAAGALAGTLDAIVLLVPPDDLAKAPQVADLLEAEADRLDDGTVVGGTAAITQDVADALLDAIRAG